MDIGLLQCQIEPLWQIILQANHTRIELIAQTLLDPPDEAWKTLQELWVLIM